MGYVYAEKDWYVWRRENIYHLRQYHAIIMTILPAAIITTSYCTSYLNKFPSTYDTLANFSFAIIFIEIY